MRKGSNDPFQFVILGPDEPLGLIALAVASRWAYRHRTAFAPFGITMTAFALAAYTHPHHARYWLLVAGITVLVTVVLAIPHRLLWSRPAGKVTESALTLLWAACGIDRGIERAYAATIIAVTGGWLAAAIAAGPLVKPLPGLAGIATVILAVPWWFHRRRRAKARVEKTISAWPDVAGNAGLAGSEILSVVVDAWGWTARVLLRKGNTTLRLNIATLTGNASTGDFDPGTKTAAGGANELDFALENLAGPCDHKHQATGHDPGVTLKHSPP